MLLEKNERKNNVFTIHEWNSMRGCVGTLPVGHTPPAVNNSLTYNA